MLVHVHVKFVIRENLAECYQRAEGDSQYLIARRPENIMICAGAGHMVAILPHAAPPKNESRRGIA
jgi:hypothetical protein